MNAKPEHLKIGDKVAVVAPASPFKRSELKAGINFFKRMGLTPVFGLHIYDKKDYLAGSDEARLADLLWALESPEIKAVFFARGGYGSMRIAAELKRKKIAPKVVMGFSDNCAILSVLSERFVVLHGPHVCSKALSNPDEKFASWIKQALMVCKPLGIFPCRLKVLKKGEARGLTIVSNLSMLTSSLSTPIEPNLADKILIVEDTNEPPYRIDRMLTQLRLSGRLKKLRALVLGSMGVNFNKLKTALEPIVEEFSGPILWGACIGHGEKNLPMPIGTNAEITTSPPRLKILESATR